MGIYSDVWAGLGELIEATSGLDQQLVVARIEDMIDAIEADVFMIGAAAATRSFADKLES